jgi:adenosine deaminase
MARQSLEHSFIPGESLWRDGLRKVSACASDGLKSDKASPACQKFLEGSEKARVQWKWEQEFKKFEREY